MSPKPRSRAGPRHRNIGLWMTIMRNSPSTSLLWRYLTFVWLFDEVPPRAGMMQRAAIVRGNRERGLRFLPVYMLRYLRMLVALVCAGIASDVMASPLLSGACFTLSTVVLVALMLSSIGFAAMWFRVFDHARW
jgi:hypothetical protein